MQVKIKALLKKAQDEERISTNTGIKLTNQLEVSRKNLKKFTCPDDEIITSEKRERELACSIQIAKINEELCQRKDALSDVFHALFLSQGLVLSGYQATNDMVDNLIICY